MDLSLVHNDPSRTLLTTSSGPKYEIDTPKDLPGAPTTILRIDSEVSAGYVGTKVGSVESRGPQETRLQLCCNNLELVLHPHLATELEK